MTYSKAIIGLVKQKVVDGELLGWITADLQIPKSVISNMVQNDYDQPKKFNGHEKVLKKGNEQSLKLAFGWLHEQGQWITTSQSKKEAIYLVLFKQSSRRWLEKAMCIEKLTNICHWHQTIDRIAFDFQGIG